MTDHEETAAETNAAERRRWNDAYQVSIWPKREKLTTAVTGLLLDHLRLTNGEKVLDVGSGGGRTSIAAGRLVGSGSVVGADISAGMVALATERAAQEHADNVSFVVRDVQVDAAPGGPFDVAMSQFGVMFFEHPVEAFSAIREQLSPDGRLGFVCWQPAIANPWHAGPALAAFVPKPRTPVPGAYPTGPFAFGDPDLVRGILSAAGWNGVERTGYELVVPVEPDTIIDEAGLAFMGVPDGSLEAAADAVRAHLDRLRDVDGQVMAPLAVQVFTALA